MQLHMISILFIVGLAAAQCNKNDGSDTPCTCACKEDPDWKLDCVHPYSTGNPCFCYADLDDPGAAISGAVGCMKLKTGVGEQICLADGCAFETDPISGGPRGCYCCSTDC
ncbi:hypothetical protein F4778DRAFT_488302 [Xylariomycetidae sp. FL2044]|nr:hypothetical protein F4778DRAFT_488302 [Xylariomycetidae sp. FL2044]